MLVNRADSHTSGARDVGHGIIFHNDNLFDYNLLKPFMIDEAPRIINKIAMMHRTRGAHAINFERGGVFWNDFNQTQARIALHMPMPIFHKPILTCLGRMIFENSICEEIDSGSKKLSAAFLIAPLSINKVPTIIKSME